MAKKKKAPRTKAELERLRDLAEDMYIRQGKTGREIADLLDISEQTITAWKKGREGEKSWDDRKRDAQLTPVKLKETLMIEAQNIATGVGSGINADQLSKVMKAINDLDKTVNPRVVMAVFQGFDNYMAETNPEKAVEFTDYHKLYLQYIISLES